jgi:hypothetical protein
MQPKYNIIETPSKIKENIKKGDKFEIYNLEKIDNTVALVKPSNIYTINNHVLQYPTGKIIIDFNNEGLTPGDMILMKPKTFSQKWNVPRFGKSQKRLENYIWSAVAPEHGGKHTKKRRNRKNKMHKKNKTYIKNKMFIKSKNNSIKKKY